MANDYPGDTIKIKNMTTNVTTTYPRPKNFAPVRQDVYAGEYTTMTGNIKADSVGWKYADIELKWDALPEDKVWFLCQLYGLIDLEFDVPYVISPTRHETVRRISTVSMRHRYQVPVLENGTIVQKIYWKDVSVKFSFINAHPHGGTL